MPNREDLLNNLDRRNFIKSIALCATLGLNMETNSKPVSLDKAPKETINFITDGLNLSPLDYSRLLLKLAEAGRIEEDDYSLSGSVEELENKFAKLLGKEQAIFM